MRRPLGPVFAAMVAALLAPAVAVADDPPSDTTPPHVVLDPCPERPAETACGRRDFVYVVQSTVDAADELAVAGVSEDGQVLTERVYDDGSGFMPYGPWLVPGNDVLTDVDYATAARLGPGRHDLTFYARDLAGNEAAFTRTVRGPTVPTRPSHIRVHQGDDHSPPSVSVTIDARGSWVRKIVLALPGGRRVSHPRVQGPPGLFRMKLSTGRLRPGHYPARIWTANAVGRGRPRSFDLHVR